MEGEGLTRLHGVRRTHLRRHAAHVRALQHPEPRQPPARRSQHDRPHRHGICVKSPPGGVGKRTASENSGPHASRSPVGGARAERLLGLELGHDVLRGLVLILVACSVCHGTRYAVRTARPRLVRVQRTYSAWGTGASCPAPLVRRHAGWAGTRSPYVQYGDSGTYVSTRLVAIAPRGGRVSVERLRLLDDLWCQGAWVGTAGCHQVPMWQVPMWRWVRHARPRRAWSVPAPCSSCPAPQAVQCAVV